MLSFNNNSNHIISHSGNRAASYSHSNHRNINEEYKLYNSNNNSNNNNNNSNHTISHSGNRAASYNHSNVCRGVHRVTDLDKFPVRVSKDEAPTPLPLFGLVI